MAGELIAANTVTHMAITNTEGIIITIMRRPDRFVLSIIIARL
jgi:hypothetical protein